MEASKQEEAAAGGKQGGGGACCRGRDGRAEESSRKESKVVVPVLHDDAEAETEPCVIAVDDSSVDRALVTALLRRSKYRGQ